MASSTFKKDAPIIKRQVFTYTISSLGANANRRVNASNLGFTIPDGYKTFACGAMGSTDSNCYVYGFSGTSGYVDIKNTNSSARSNVQVTLVASFIREDLFEAI